MPWTRAPRPPYTHPGTEAPTQHTPAGTRGLLAAAAASPPARAGLRPAPPTRRRAGGRAGSCGSSWWRVKRLPSADRAPLCQQGYSWTYPRSPGARYLPGEAEPNDQVPLPHLGGFFKPLHHSSRLLFLFLQRTSKTHTLSSPLLPLWREVGLLSSIK